MKRSFRGGDFRSKYLCVAGSLLIPFTFLFAEIPRKKMETTICIKILSLELNENAKTNN